MDFEKLTATNNKKEVESRPLRSSKDISMEKVEKKQAEDNNIKSIADNARSEYARIFRELKNSGDPLSEESLYDSNSEFYKKVNFHDNKILGDAINKLAKATGVFDPGFFEKIEKEVLDKIKEGDVSTNEKANQWPYNMEAPKTINEQRQEFVDKELKNAEKLIAMQKFSSIEERAMAIEKLKSAARELFDSWAANTLAGVTTDDIKFLDEAENPYNYMGMSAEEKMRLYDLQDRIKSAKEGIEEKREENNESEEPEGKVIEGSISISEEKKKEIHEKVMKEEERRRKKAVEKINAEKPLFKNNAENKKAEKKPFGNYTSPVDIKVFNSMMSDVKDFTKLDTLIDECGGIQGSEEFFEPTKLKDIVRRVRKKELGINHVTSTLGLRDKVVELMKMDEIRKKINPENPDKPSDFPPDAEWLTDKDIKELGINFAEIRPYSIDAPSGLRERFGEYPEIGAYGLNTEFGQINGRLIWCDGNMAIFETPQGKIKMPFKKLVAPSGSTYEQIEKKYKDEKHHRRLLNDKPRARYMEQ